MRESLVILAVVFVARVSTLVGQAPDRPAAYTAEQAEAGRIELQQNSFGACTDCHTTTLAGRGPEDKSDERPLLSSLSDSHQDLIRRAGGVPNLVGPGFRARWAMRSTKELTANFQERFAPPAAHLSEQTRLNIVAYILQANGALPGTRPLTMGTDVEIRTIIPVGAPR